MARGCMCGREGGMPGRGGVRGREACMVGSMHGGGGMCGGGCVAGECVWQGACMAGGMHGRGGHV